MQKEIEKLVEKFERKTLSRRELVTSLIGIAGVLAASPVYWR